MYMRLPTFILRSNTQDIHQTKLILGIQTDYGTQRKRRVNQFAGIGVG